MESEVEKVIITIEVSEPEKNGAVLKTSRYTMTESEYQDCVFDIANGLIKSMIRKVKEKQ